MATRAYFAKGRDGFDALVNSNFIVDDNDGMLLSAIIRRYFTGLRVVNMLADAVYHHHRTSSNNSSNSSSSSPTTPSIQLVTNENSPTVHGTSASMDVVQQFARKWHSETVRRINSRYKSEDNNEQTSLRAHLDSLTEGIPVIAPVIEGRIVDISSRN
ncbi:hypothetical protein HK096_001031 [Nowakowskiella sp. JEL0078]|nr:hypothetical protein HK096_001031 [Nowakowskiella sp. JEL0078]